MRKHIRCFFYCSSKHWSNKIRRNHFSEKKLGSISWHGTFSSCPKFIYFKSAWLTISPAFGWQKKD